MRCGGSPNPVPGALCCSAFSVAGSSLTSLSARRSLRRSILRRGGAFRAGPGCGCGRGFFSSLRSSAAPDGHGASITISSPRPSCAKRPLTPAGGSPTSSGRPRGIPTRCCCRRDPAASASGSFERGPLPEYATLVPLGGHLIGALVGRWRKSQLFEQGHQSRIFVHHVNVDWRNPLLERYLAEKHRHPLLEPQTPRERNDEQRTEAKAFERKSLILECAQVRKSTPSAEAIHCRDRCTLAIPSRQQLLFQEVGRINQVLPSENPQILDVEQVEQSHADRPEQSSAHPRRQHAQLYAANSADCRPCQRADAGLISATLKKAKRMAR